MLRAPAPLRTVRGMADPSERIDVVKIRSGNPRANGRHVSPRYRHDDDSVEGRIGRQVVVQPNGCWVLKGKADEYGVIVVGGKSYLAHRFIFERLVGPIRKGCHIHHVCETKGCCNPEHLRELTPSEHMSLHHELRRGAA